MSGLDEMHSLFAKEHLPLPPIPADLAARIILLAPWTFGTRTGTPSLYSFAWFVDEALQRQPDEYVMVGHAGHGVNSWAIHCYLVHGSIALFLQCAWGGIYMDNDEATLRMAVRFQQSERLLAALDDARNQGIWAAPDRLVVSVSDFYGARWAILDGDSRPDAQDIWHEDGDALADALAYVSNPGSSTG